MNRQNFPVKFEFDWTKPFSSTSPETEMLTDRQTDNKETNEQTEIHQFQKEPSYDGDLSPCQVWIRLDTAFLS